MRVKFQGDKIKKKTIFSVTDSYVHKTKLNGILVLDESYTI